jgi:hypothetical protein
VHIHSLIYLAYTDCLLTGRDQLLSTLKSVERMPEYDRKACLPKTRLDVIKSITDWIADESNDQKSVFWLHGLAGSGKSTLSTTIARMMRDLRRLGAFFFFDRDIPERNATVLITTLAYQLAQFDTRIGAEMSRIVQSIPGIAGMPLDFQFTNLLSAKALRSVEWLHGPIVLVIDAFDECGNQKHRRDLLQALSKGFQDLPSFVRVMVVSRKEPDIQRALGSNPAVYSYPLDINSTTNYDDISVYVRHRLCEIRMENKYLHSVPHWPGDDNINTLTKLAGGLFIWASTACSYIEGYDPYQRLKKLLKRQSEVDSSEPFVALDRLYKTGLQSAGWWGDHSFRTDCCNILGVILCGRIPLTCAIIDSLLALPLSRPCFQSISYLGCVLRVSKTEEIRILHPSFHDYLSKRCTAEPWSINLE